MFLLATLLRFCRFFQYPLEMNVQCRSLLHSQILRRIRGPIPSPMVDFDRYTDTIQLL